MCAPREEPLIDDRSWYSRGVTFPEWWDWELELTPHLEKRMEDRSFTEVQLRLMLERATGFRRDVIDGCYVVETRFRARAWG